VQLALSSGVKVRREEWGLLVFDRRTRSVYEVGLDAAPALEACARGAGFEEVLAAVAAASPKPPDSLRNELEDFLAQMRELGLLDSGPAAERLPKRGRGRLVNENESERGVVIGDFSRTPLKGPISVSVEVTSACNLLCRHCYADAVDGRRETDLNVQDYLGLIDELDRLDVFNVSITGGEPLTFQGVFDVIEECSRREMSALLSTNGTLLDPDTIKHLESAGLRTIQVSIDALESRVHDWFRGVSGAHARALAGLKRACDSRIPEIRVATVASTLNIDQIVPLMYELDRLGVQVVRILRFLPLGRGREGHEFALGNDKVVMLLNQIKEHLPNMKTLAVNFSDAFNPPIIERPSHSCSGGVTWCAINPAGYVVPCTYLNSPRTAASIGAWSLRERGLAEVWRNSPLFSDIRRIRQVVKGKCKQCAYLAECGGGCRAAAYAYTGDILACDPHCRYEPLATTGNPGALDVRTAG
jgi:radical SAM protein with 4Fe4S-binding SPASM domain